MDGEAIAIRCPRDVEEKPVRKPVVEQGIGSGNGGAVCHFWTGGASAVLCRSVRLRALLNWLLRLSTSRPTRMVRPTAFAFRVNRKRSADTFCPEFVLIVPVRNVAEGLSGSSMRA